MRNKKRLLQLSFIFILSVGADAFKCSGDGNINLSGNAGGSTSCTSPTTLGENTSGGFEDQATWDKAQEITLSAATTLTSARFWIRSIGSARDVTVTVYDDAGSDPEDGNSQGSATTNVGTTSSWVDFDFGAGLSLSAGTYWLVIRSGGSFGIDFNDSNNYTGGTGWRQNSGWNVLPLGSPDSDYRFGFLGCQ